MALLPVIEGLSSAKDEVVMNDQQSLPLLAPNPPTPYTLPIILASFVKFVKCSDLKVQKVLSLFVTKQFAQLLLRINGN